MPIKPRVYPIGIPQHVIQRGNNRQACFTSEQDFKAYAGWLKEYSRKFHVEIHAWVFMKNHVHLLFTPQKENAVSLMNIISFNLIYTKITINHLRFPELC